MTITADYHRTTKRHPCPEKPGDRVGRWTLVSRQRTASGRLGWLCRCECGEESVVLTHKLRSGQSRSCGCLKADVAGALKTTHGMSDNPAYMIWAGMRDRCVNPNNARWKDYGGRGISVCDRWSSFENFMEDMGERQDGTTLDRIDNSRGYEPSNCRWATSAEQARNKRSNVVIEWQGVSMCLTDWAEQIGMSRDVLASRIKRGWTVERAFTQEVRHAAS